MNRLLALACMAIAGPALAETAQGLTSAEQQRFFHLAEGSEAFPYLWMRALESPATHKPFFEHPERFGLLPDPSNGEGLPIGFATSVPKDLQFSGARMTGMSCAACHVGAIHYAGKSMTVIGGPSFFDGGAFGDELKRAFLETARSPDKLMKFMHRLLELEHADKHAVAAALPPATQKALRAQLPAIVAHDQKGTLGAAAREHLGRLLTGTRTAQMKARLSAELASGKVRVEAALAKLEPQKRAAEIEPVLASAAEVAKLLEERAKVLVSEASGKVKVVAGSGRADAFGNVYHRLFAKQGAPPAFAPVSFPQIWEASRTPWYHYDGNTDSIIERNVGQAMGIGAVYDPKNFVSTLLPRNVHEAESIAWKLTPPLWPEAILGAIDPAKKARGEHLYQQNCASCHTAKVFELVDPKVVGTDPARIISGQQMITTAGGKRESALFVLGHAIEDVLNQSVHTQGIPAAEAAAMRKGRPNPANYRMTGKYKILSLRGVWATGPYLHNGSVPTLHDLLLPAAQRPKRFLLGSYQFDPVKVGFVTSTSDPLHFTLDTSLAGNHNTGHEFGTRMPEADRMALLEYLKTL